MGNSGISHKTRERSPGAGFSLEVPMKSKLVLLSLLFLLSSVALASTVRTLQVPAAPMTVAFGPEQYTARPRLPLPKQSESPAVPADQGIRLDNCKGIAPVEKSHELGECETNRIGSPPGFL